MTRETAFATPGKRGLVAGGPETITVSIDRFAGSDVGATEDFLAREEPLEIQLVYGPLGSRRLKSISVTMRTPGNDIELAAGFLLTEGVVDDVSDITTIVDMTLPLVMEERDNGGKPLVLSSRVHHVVRAELDPQVSVKAATLERNFFMTSSCGICGKASLMALRTVAPPRATNDFEISADLLYTLPSRLRNAQEAFQETGGLHAAGLFDFKGELMSLREDVGRHNAVDKLLGAEFLCDRSPLRDRLLLLSGRASFELLQKALMAGIPMVVALGAPSSLAVQVAREFDITLIGFLRWNHFNVYHGVNKITHSSLTPLTEVI